eukprot:TRINITY_DN18150_c0_g1_i1.p1 TRINITY_DN18150_c0_g1~~TRINITY_DN18150_c0_g1_i1.p1  ORF type:complete len:119 (-),score=42.78 TRINITY_DN18150_c0_g1_i1:115-471(-)
MGKRKSSKKPVARKAQPKVPKVFDCPFCNHEQTVEANIDKLHSIGTVSCRVCGAKYQMNITSLTAPVDIFSEWVDRCEEEKARELDPAADYEREEDAYGREADEYDEDGAGYADEDDF